jgi:hypothetical protein
MFGDHFYHQRIKKSVAIFGSLFNNLYVVRKNTSGFVISQVKVPLSYAPKRDFLDRLDKMNTEGDNGERQIAVKLPRMSFEITSMGYDPTRQLPKMNQCTVPSTIFDGKAQKLYSPVPYNIGFQLSIYAKSQDDALQVVEQILPFFTPQYTVTVNPLDNFDVKEDTPITLTGVGFSDDYEALLEARRTIIYTLDFEMKINLYKGVAASSAIITQYDIDILSFDGSELFTTISDSANVPYYNTGSLFENSSLTVDTFKIRNVPRTTSGFFIADSPSYGSASVSYDGTLTTVNGVIVATGSWTYTPDSNYYGADTFNIGINWGNDNLAQFTVPVNVNVLNIVNTITDSVNVEYETALNFFVSGNDTLLGPVTYSVASGGNPSHGTATVLNASTGQFRYTPDSGYSGLDSFVYRATPSVGTSETATVNVLVAEPVPFVFTDNFNRVDGSLGSDWDVSGLIAIISNQASPSFGGATGTASISTATHTWRTSDRYAQLTISQWNNDPISLYLSSDVYARFAQFVTIRIYGTVGFDSGISATSGDIIKLSVVGTTVYLYKNGTQVWTTTLSVATPLTGQPGFGFLNQSSPGNPAIDDFEAGEIF